MSNKDKVKSVVATIISIVIIIISLNLHNTGVSKTSLSKDYIKFTITDLQENNGTFIATVKSDKEGYYDHIDITNAFMDSDLERVIGSKLYFGKPDNKKEIGSNKFILNIK